MNWGMNQSKIVTVMSENKQARLVGRDRTSYHGWQFEIWDIGGGRGIYIDFYDSDSRTLPYETGSKAFPVDMSRLMADGEMIGSWPYNALGGKAIRELGYEPIEEDGQYDATASHDYTR